MSAGAPSPTEAPIHLEGLPGAPEGEPGRSLGAQLAATAIVAVLLSPLVPLVLFSVGHQYFFPQILPERLTGRAWRIVLEPGSEVWAATGETLAIGTIVTVLSLLVAVPAGRALGTRAFPGKRAVELLLLVPVIVPTIAVAVGIHVTFLRYGLADTFLGVVLVHLVPCTPYAVLVMAGVFANYDRDIEDQARTLGASWPRTFWHVTLPAIRPGLAVAALFAFLISWSQYVLTLLIGGGNVVTLPILLFAFASGGDTALTSALTLFYVAPVVVLLLIVAPHLTGRSVALGGFGRV